METLLGNGIFNSDGETWKEQRKAASVDFSTRTLRTNSTVVFKEKALTLALLLLQNEDKGKSMDMQDLFMRMTLDSIGKLAFGVDIGTLPCQWPLPDNDFAKAFDMANDIVTRRFIDPFWKLKSFLNIGSESNLASCMKTINDFTYNFIETRKKEIASESSTTSVQGQFLAPKLDIVTRILGGDGVDDQQLRDTVLNFVIAGRDTTAVTLSWLVYQLSERPDVAHSLYQELLLFDHSHVNASNDCLAAEILPSKRTKRQSKIREFSNILSFDSLKKAERLPYLQAVISETLRLYPAVPLDPKEVLEDDVLPDGTHLNKGGLISYSPYCMARVSENWGPDAKDFRPERWLSKNPDGSFHPESEFKFATFQAGPRTCLGKDSAYLQIKMTAAILGRFFEFTLDTGHHVGRLVRYRMMAILSVDSGLRVYAKFRQEEGSTD